MDKVTVKVDRDVYKALQQLKLDTESKSISDTIKTLLKKGK